MTIDNTDIMMIITCFNGIKVIIKIIRINSEQDRKIT